MVLLPLMLISPSSAVEYVVPGRVSLTFDTWIPGLSDSPLNEYSEKPYLVNFTGIRKCLTSPGSTWISNLPVGWASSR